MARNRSSPNPRHSPRTLRQRPQRHNNIIVEDDENEHHDQEDGSMDEEDEENDTDNKEKLKRLRTRHSAPKPFLPNNLESQRERESSVILPVAICLNCDFKK
jgi:hypothetical protein